MKIILYTIRNIISRISSNPFYIHDVCEKLKKRTFTNRKYSR